jgi:hypothetical protein
MRIILIFLIFLISRADSQASAFWMEVIQPAKNSSLVTVRVCYGYIDDLSVRHRTSGSEFESIKLFDFKIRASSGQDSPLLLVKKADCWEGTFSAKANTFYQIIGVNTKLPVIVRNAKDSSKNIRSIEYLYGEYGRSSTPDTLPIIAEGPYIQLIAQKDSYQILPYIYGKRPTKESTIRIFNPENWEKNIPVDTAANIVFRVTQKGMYVIRLDWYENSPGEDQGIPFMRIRHRCNYCLNL